MKIAALIASYSHFNELKNNFIYQCLTALAFNNSSSEIFFITDKDFISPSEKLTNIHFLSVVPSKKQTLSRLYWSAFSLPTLLNNLRIDFFLYNKLSSEKKITAKKIMIADDLSQLNTTKKNILTANLIVLTTDYVAQQTEKIVGLSKDKIAVIPPGIQNNILPIEFDIKEKIKNEYANGAEYFYFDGRFANIDSIIKTLKAFSFFKKWQQSSMKMMIPTNKKNYKEFNSLLANYKFREDVICLDEEYTDDIPLLSAASYAGVFLPEKNLLPASMMDCLARQIPLILPDNEFYRSFFGNAVLIAKDSIESISEKLILLYKNESVRNELISHASKLSARLTWQNAADELRKRIKELK